MAFRSWIRGLAGLIVAVAMITCSRKGADVGGLELEIINDGSLAVDVLHVGVETTGANPRVLLSRDYKVPAEATLPTTLGIASNGDPTATVSITVSAYHLDGAVRVALDRRDNLVTQIPTDRVVALRVVLSAACGAHVTTNASTDAQSDCKTGTTCNPTTGDCASSTVSAATLSPYTPGDEQDASVGDGGQTLTHSVGGSATGVLGTGLVLQNNAGDNLPIAANGSFTFATKLKAGTAYAVTIKTQPTAPSQTCTVSGGTGTMGAGDVTSVTVNCASNKFTVGGTASGIVGTGLVLQNNAGDDLVVSANGTFAFATTLLDAAAYAVTVKTQPGSPSQTCAVTNGSGTIAAANATNVTVTCTTNKYTVGGTAAGLVGSGLVLQNNAGDDLTVAASGAFTFATSIASGASYAVTVKTQPTSPTQTCTVSGGTGTVGAANVTSVTVNCATNTYTIGGMAAGLVGSGLVLQNNAGDDLTVNGNGSFAFGTPIASGATYAVTVKTNPTNPSQTCVVGSASGTVGGANVTSVTVNCATNSCATSGDGLTNCGGGSESCCTSLLVSGGTYNRTYTNTGSGPTAEADPATVSDFRLDKYEVTVGRFRQFVAAWNNGSGWTPPQASGKHIHLNGGSGLAATGGGYEPGWATSDNGNIAPTNGNLLCDTYQTWTPTSAGGHEKLPANCVNWWEAVAFCIWDGGFLPSEAEWEYAAAGGSAEREYPWGPTAPGTSNQYAIYGCYYPSSSGSCTDVSNIGRVGTPTAGAGKYGQLDLAGNVWEWNLDWYAASYSTCTNCTNATSASTRVFRGGSFSYATSYLLPPYRDNFMPPATRSNSLGFRCARTP